MAEKKCSFDGLGYYNILGVSKFVLDDELKQKYRDLAKFWHPDYNKDVKAVDIFQQLSIAYEVLKNPETRLKYDLLSLIYNKSNFPNMNALSVLRNIHGQEDVNMRAFRLIEITGKGLTHKKIEKTYYCSQYEAMSVVKQITKHNWLKGFWGLSAFWANIIAIVKNISNIENRKENLFLCLHNSIAYHDENKNEEALTLAILAKNFANKDELPCIESYIRTFTNTNPYGLKEWNLSKLKTAQIMYPVYFVVTLLFLFTARYLHNIEMIKKNTDSVKEVVIFSDGKRAFSDVAVAKIFEIPVDVYDKTMLYHVTSRVDARHGADLSFDVYETIEKNTTVRVTGQTVDNKWLRVMFDNGEMAFIESSKLEKGIGKDIPLWSKIYKEN